MSKQRPIEGQKQLTPAGARAQIELTHYMAARTVGLTVLTRDGFEALEYGTGICIQIAGHYFLATAAHIAGHWPDRHVYSTMEGPPSDGVLKIIDGGMEGSKEPFSEVDVGWLEYAPAAAKRSGKTFMGLADLAAGAQLYPGQIAHLLVPRHRGNDRLRSEGRDFRDG